LRRASSASVAFLKPFLRASVRDEGRSIVAGRGHGSDGARRVWSVRCLCRRVALLAARERELAKYGLRLSDSAPLVADLQSTDR
jgi:hypothetical protein